MMGRCRRELGPPEREGGRPGGGRSRGRRLYGRLRSGRERATHGARLGRLVVGAALSIAGCGDDVAPDRGRVEIEPPALYESLWQGVEQCSGITAPFDRVRWFVVWEFGASPTIFGQWNARREISLRSDVWLDSQVIRHEILHDLLGGDGAHTNGAWDECDIDVGIPEG